MSHCPGNSHSTGRREKKWWVWAALGAVLVLYVFSVLRARPVATFGVFVDDALYFSSAKALAAGQGYILPGFPGRLPSMKYPELFPILLAGVWKLDPHFPGNLRLAAGLSIGFGCLALLAIFLMLRRWPGLGDWPALAIVFLTGVCSTLPYQSAILGSDIPFMAVMLGAVWVAERSLAGEPGNGAAFVSGLLVGMSVGMRSLGIPVAAGIGLLLLVRRKFRRLFWFCLAGLPLTLLWSWPTVSGVLGLSRSAAAHDATPSGWAQTVCWYSSYGCAWRMQTPSLSTLKTTIVLNLRLIAQAPGETLLVPLATGNKILDLVLVMLLSVGVWVGIVRHGRRTGWRPVHAVLPLYLLVIVVCPYNPARYLLPFLPLFFAGLWTECGHIGRLFAGRLKQGCGRDERVAAGILAVGAMAMAATVAVNLGYSLPRKIGDLGTEHEEVSADEQGAYEWLRQHAAPKARIIAYEDGLTYLSTGRASIRSIFCIADADYVKDPRYARQDIVQLPDVAKHVDASYWLTTPYDYPLQKPANQERLRAREKELLAAAPVVYRSPDGRVVLYDTRCLWDVEGAGCAPNEADGSRSRQ